MKIEHEWYPNLELHEWVLRIRKNPILMIQWEAPGNGWGWSWERIDGGKDIGICAGRLLITFGL